MDESSAPIVVDLGKRKRKQLRALERGEGPLAQEVTEAMEHVQQRLGAATGGRKLVPVVVVYRRKPGKRSRFQFRP